MASPGPEGLCVFHRSLLHTSNWHGGSDINDFKNFILLDVVVNKSWDEQWEGKGAPDLPKEGNPRAEKQVIPYNNVRYVRWRNLYCATGRHTSSMQRASIIHGNGDGRNLSQYKKFVQSAFIPVPMPTPEERFLWVDLTYPIRGIYMPSAFYHSQQAKYKDYARYAFVNFTAVKNVSLTTYEAQKLDLLSLNGGFGFPALSSGKKGADKKKQEKTVPEPDVPESLLDELTRQFRRFTVGKLDIDVDETMGLGWHPHFTARFDIKMLEQVLHVPEESRDKKYLDVYQFITLFEASSVSSLETWQTSRVKEGEMGDDAYVKLADVVSKHTGIKFKEEETEGTTEWMKEIVKNLITAGLGLIPYVGPFLSLGAETLADYLEDPEGWGAKNELKLGTDATAEAVQAGKEILSFYRKGKVPGIRLKKSHLQGDERKPVYVGGDGDGGEPPQGSTEDEAGDKGDTQVDKPEIENEDGIPQVKLVYDVKQ